MNFLKFRNEKEFFFFFFVKRHDILKHKPENKTYYNLATEAKVVAICL